MRNKTLTFGILLIFGLLVSCKSTRQITTTTSKALTYKTLSAPLKLTILPGSGQAASSVDAQLKIVKGEAIQLSLRMPFLGSEVGRVTITPEKILLLDRWNQRYFVTSPAELGSLLNYPLNYADLEALFTGQLQDKQRLQPLQLEYLEWGATADNQAFPLLIQTLLATPDDRFGMEWKFKSVEVNPDFSIDTNIPANYQPITWEQAAKMIRKL
jgi:hypothetical protein